jgi:hypothetical protein
MPDMWFDWETRRAIWGIAFLLCPKAALAGQSSRERAPPLIQSQMAACRLRAERGV